MLRVLKEKVAKTEERGSAFLFSPERDHSVSGTRANFSTHLLPPTASAVILTHVPVSVGSRNGPSSSESTISSHGGIESLVDVDDLTAKPERESPRESSIPPRFTHTLLAPRASLVTPILPNTRKIHDISKQDTQTLLVPCDRPSKRVCREDSFAKATTNLEDAPIGLLGRPQDQHVLPPLHVFVRKHIQVFCATAHDLAQPAPGRKKPLQLGQVGLRCLYCHHVPSRRRVKRAVCYPSSVSRVYHAVSDMKFDHFSACPHLPDDVRAEFENIKNGKLSVSGNNSTASKTASSCTAQYYHDAAVEMGMINGPGGIFLSTASPFFRPQLSSSLRKASIPPAPVPKKDVPPKKILPRAKPASSGPASVVKDATSTATNNKLLILSQATDDTCLNPLHCFVRKQIEVFAATPEDLAAPAPGRKTKIALGQVGLRCIHCKDLPPKDRVKRNVCYPPSVDGIYHAVSNMKFDHFCACKGMPSTARQEFSELQQSCGRRGSAGNGIPKTAQWLASSTAQYYTEMAKNLGLIDSSRGIRFASMEQPTGLSALMLAAASQTAAL